MRIYTLALSIVAHVAAVTIIIVAPLIATDVLPEPRRSVEFYTVTPAIIQPPPVRIRTNTPPPAAALDAAPVEPPRGIEAEPDVPPPTTVDPDPSTIDGVPLVGEFVAADPVPPPPVERPPVRVGGSISRPERIRYVPPVYPPLALAARREGTVILEAIIGADGMVREARVLRSVTLLDAAALEAVQQWQFTPTLLNGEAVPVVMTVTVTFTLR